MGGARQTEKPESNRPRGGGRAPSEGWAGVERALPGAALDTDQLGCTPGS